MNKLLTQMEFLSSFYYRVEGCDNINSIADTFHTTPAVIIGQNNLTEQITKGQLLFISVLDGEEYVVKPHDTLSSLANYDERVERSIKNKNMIDTVYVGQKLIL